MRRADETRGEQSGSDGLITPCGTITNHERPVNSKEPGTSWRWFPGPRVVGLTSPLLKFSQAPTGALRLSETTDPKEREER